MAGEEVFSAPTYGVLALDPGGSSGVAMARFRDEGTIEERLLKRSHFATHTVKGEWMTQARIISRMWFEFRLACHKAGLPSYFVCEDFILTRLKSSDRSGIYPVWVAAAVVGYRNGMADAYEAGGFGPAAPIEVTWQQPSQAKTHATDARLKGWELWIKGREHERDACRHLAYFVANAASQRMRTVHSRERVRTHEPPL